jgi:glutathione S-transferase
MLKLYFAPGSSSLASHIALEEAGARFETQLVDEHGGEHKRPAYLAINPRGKVPALRLPSGDILVENTAILAYVARTHPDAGLLPRDAEGEARALSLMAFFASAVHPAFAHFYAPQRFTADAAGEAGVKARGLESFHAHCGELDARLAGRDWFLDDWSAVDCYAFLFWRWGSRAGLPMSELRHLTAHRERMLARPAVQRVLQREGIA